MPESHNIFNSKYLNDYRKILRKNAISAEATLWKLLKTRQLDGRKFRRQYSIDKYIVDFCCPSEKLIVELDGDVHGDKIRIQNVTIRDHYLQDLGFIVLRFENRFVFQNPEYVMSEIKKIFNRESEVQTENS